MPLLYLVEAIEVAVKWGNEFSQLFEMFQNLSEIISGWLALEEERFWARPTSTNTHTHIGTLLCVLFRHLSFQKKDVGAGALRA